MNTIVRYTTLFNLTLVASAVLSACGGGGGGGGSAPVVTPPLPAFYVDATTGLDTNAGTVAAPFKSLTKAINAASAVGAVNIYAASGVYDAANGETFPLMVANGQNLIGAGSAVISGGGVYHMILSGGGGLTGNGSLVFASGVSASVSGYSFPIGTAVAIWVDNAPSVTISGNTIGTTFGLIAGNNSKVTLSANNIDTSVVAVEALGPGVKVTARGNTFNSTSSGVGVRTGNYYPTLADSELDLGTAASPGNNKLQSINEGLASMSVASSVPITAVGNKWKLNTQGADATGQYAAGLVTGPVVPTIPKGNYIISGTNSIQF